MNINDNDSYNYNKSGSEKKIYQKSGSESMSKSISKSFDNLKIR